MSTSIPPSSAVRTSPLKVRLAYSDDFTTLPLVYGLEGVVRSAVVRRMQNMDEVRTAFNSGELEVGLLPAADVLKQKDAAIIPTAAVSALGASRMMVLYAKSIPTEIRRVLVDAEDLGSIPLGQLVLGKKLSIRPEFERSATPINPAQYDFSAKDGYDAYLLTGRNAFAVRKEQFSFSMDLTLAWYEMTRMPFVIHLWVMRKNARIMMLDKELGDVAKRNDGNNETYARVSERVSVSETGVKAVFQKAFVTSFDPTIATAFRKFGQELAAARILAAQPVPLFTPPAVRKV